MEPNTPSSDNPQTFEQMFSRSNGDPTQFAKNMSSRLEAERFFKQHPSEMTLDNLLQANVAVYVQNNLDADHPGLLTLTFSISGKKQALTIPNSILPIRLNDYMTAKDISDAGDLRDMLRKGALVLLHPQDAEKILSTDWAVREQARYKSSITKAAAAAGNGARTSIGGPVTKAPEGVVSDRMKSYVVELQENLKDTVKKQEILDRIYAQQKSFNFADVQYFQKAVENDQASSDVAAELLIIVGSR